MNRRYVFETAHNKTTWRLSGISVKAYGVLAAETRGPIWRRWGDTAWNGFGKQGYIKGNRQYELGKRICYHARMPETGNIIITHHSAASYWLHADLGDKALVVAEGDPRANCACNSKDLQRFDSRFPGFGGRPIHLLVDDKRLTRSSGNIVTHVSAADLPKGSFVKLRKDLYVSSPELCLVQMARYLSEIKLVELAMNLCASYYIHPLTDKIETRKHRLTTPETLSEYARRSSLRGSVKVANCISLAIPDSRSPVETKLSALLRQAPSRGGEGFPGHTLNYHVDAKEHAEIAEQDDFYIDIAYADPQVGIEYYGEEFHKDTAKDRRRLNALRSLGWNILTVEKQQLYNPGLFALFANQLAACLEIEIAHPWDWRAKNERLRFDLGLV